MAKYKIVEKKNHKCIHAVCSSLDSAESWLKDRMPEYVKKGYFDDKTLDVDSFMICEN